MSADGIRFRALLDAGVPDSVGRVLNGSGHGVIYHRDVLPEKTPDPVVAFIAQQNNAVLIAIDNDMKQIAQRYGVASHSDRFSRLNLIRLCCNEVLAAKRLEHAMSFVEVEWEFSTRKSARRMWVDIGAHFLRTNR